MRKSTRAFLLDVTNAPSMEELWHMHTEQMAGFGFDRLIYGYTRFRHGQSLGDPQDWVVLTNQSMEYMKVFVDQGLYSEAPMLKWALENDGACSWGRMADLSVMSESEAKVISFNQSMNVRAGYTVSFRSVSHRSKGAIALTAAAGLGQADIDATWSEFGDDIILMNNVVHLKILTLPYSGPRALTERQREVLQWVGDGKTTQDIALLLSVSAATVEKHLRLARESMDVETTAQAVLKASFYNQMFILDA